MATSTTKTKIMKLSQAEYTTLSTTGTLTKDGVTYTYSPNDTIYVTPNTNVTQAELTAGLATKADASTTYTKTEVDTALSGKANAPLTFSNLSVATTDWVADNTYSDLPYKAIIACQGVTASDVADVYLAPASADLHAVADFCDEGTNSVTIYASTNENAITIKRIEVK